MERIIKSLHTTVLKEEAVELLAPVTGATYFDGTFGGGGHTKLLLEKSAPKGRVVAVDLDSSVEKFASELEKKYGERFEFHHMSYVDVSKLSERFDGALLDLGLSSDQLGEDESRGFTFQGDQYLDLRFDATRGQTASQLLNQSSLPRLEQIFRDYAQDRFYKKLASRIVETRRKAPVQRASDLIALIGTDQPKVLAPIWQALRIAVNDELSNVERGLKEITQVLKKDAVFSVISFHSLEDAIVKKFFRDCPELEVITKKTIQPSNEEVSKNPRSRSAKLRAARKINH